eukprot:s41_g12.t1
MNGEFAIRGVLKMWIPKSPWELGELIEKYDLDGVDYNWEYPGYRFGQGYLADSEVTADYEGLSKLLKGYTLFSDQYIDS